MAAGRSLKSLLSRRRRLDDGEDEEGSMLEGDSEGSIKSDVDDDDDHDDVSTSSLGGRSAPEAGGNDEVSSIVKQDVGTRKVNTRNSRKKSKQSKKLHEGPVEDPAGFKSTADTEAMMSGLQADESAQAVDFESMGPINNSDVTAVTSTTSMKYGANVSVTETPASRQHREHEEHRRRRDLVPASNPYRGNFFMHDTRQTIRGPAPSARGAWPGRGRGRGAPRSAEDVVRSNPSRTEQADEQPWKHDLHDTINEEPPQPVSRTTDTSRQRHAGLQAHRLPVPTASGQRQNEPHVISFSSSTLVGKVQIRVFLPGMEKPVSFSEVPWKHYIRLPNHRPPLRRDKPVRISVPEHVQRYIFPSSDRSFIFIPRQMRPNQQGYGRPNYQRNTAGGGYGYSSRRTSMHGGSMYSASVAASRRSSAAGVSRADAFSPNSFASGVLGPNRPVVRLPHGSAGQAYSGATTPSGRRSGQHTPTYGLHNIHTYPLPQQPAFQGTPTSTVHQPQPLKNISVTGIESPAALQWAPPSQESQPFQNQLPAHMNEQHTNFDQQPAPYVSPRQQHHYPQQAHRITPMSGIPEQVMHAQPFQPQHAHFENQSYYAPYPPQHNYYYSAPPPPSGYVPMPVYNSQGYMVSLPGPSHLTPSETLPPPNQPPLAPQQLPSRAGDDNAPSRSQSGMVAHESNGMVFYLPASDARQQSQSDNYQPAEGFVPSYAMPGLPPPTPAPELAYYYPPVQMQGDYYPTQA